MLSYCFPLWLASVILTHSLHSSGQFYAVIHSTIRVYGHPAINYYLHLFTRSSSPFFQIIGIDKARASKLPANNWVSSLCHVTSQPNTPLIPLIPTGPLQHLRLQLNSPPSIHPIGFNWSYDVKKTLLIIISPLLLSHPLQRISFPCVHILIIIKPLQLTRHLQDCQSHASNVRHLFL